MPLPLTGGPAPLLLVAERDTPARQFLADNFAADGYDVIPAADYDGAVRALTGDRQVAAVVVDLAGDTLRLIDAVRRDDHRLDAGLPILAFATGPEALHRVRLLERGVEDAMIKPFSYAELRLRVAHLVSYGEGRPVARASVRVGPVRVDTRRRAVTVDDVDVLLTNREYELLMLFVADPTHTTPARSSPASGGATPAAHGRWTPRACACAPSWATAATASSPTCGASGTASSSPRSSPPGSVRHERRHHSSGRNHRGGRRALRL